MFASGEEAVKMKADEWKIIQLDNQVVNVCGTNRTAPRSPQCPVLLDYILFISICAPAAMSSTCSPQIYPVLLLVELR